MTGISAGKTWSRIGAEVAPTSSAASGVWQMQEVAENVSGGTWPEPKDGWFYIFNYQPGTYGTTARGLGVNSSTGQLALAGTSYNPTVGAYAATYPLISSSGSLNTTTQPIIRDVSTASAVYTQEGIKLDHNSSGEWIIPFRDSGASQDNVGFTMIEADGTSMFTPVGFGQASSGYYFSSECGKFDSTNRPIFSYKTESSTSGGREQYEIWCFPNTFAASPSSSASFKVRVYPSSYTGYPYYNKFNPDGGIVVGASDDVYIAFQKGLDAGLYSGSVGAYPWALAKYNSSGTQQWMYYYGMSYGGSFKTGFQKFCSIDSSDNVYLTGYNADNGTSGTPCIMQKVDSSGTHQWHRCFYNTTASQGNTHPYYSWGGNCKSDGSVILQTAYTYLDTSSSVYKGLIFAMNSSGTVQWAYKISAKKTSDNSEQHITGGQVSFDDTGNYLYYNCDLTWDGRSLMTALKIKGDGTHDASATVDVWDVGGSSTTNLTLTVEPLLASEYSSSNSYFSVTSGSLTSSSGYYNESGTTTGQYYTTTSGSYGSSTIDAYSRVNETTTGGI